MLGVTVALLLFVCYWVDMAMNYNYFEIIPKTVVETWQQIPLGLNAKKYPDLPPGWPVPLRLRVDELPPLYFNIFMNYWNFCSILLIWCALEMNHGLVKTAFLITICSLGGSMVQAMLPLPLQFFVPSYHQVSGAWGFTILLRAILQ